MIATACSNSGCNSSSTLDQIRSYTKLMMAKMKSDHPFHTFMYSFIDCPV